MHNIILFAIRSKKYIIYKLIRNSQAPQHIYIRITQMISTVVRFGQGGLFEKPEWLSWFSLFELGWFTGLDGPLG